MPFARIDLLKGKTAEYRATVADVVYQGIVDVLKAPEGDRFVVISEHSPENLIYDQRFLGWDRSSDFILIQVTSTVGNTKELKLAFFRYVADELKSKLSVRAYRGRCCPGAALRRRLRRPANSRCHRPNLEMTTPAMI